MLGFGAGAFRDLAQHPAKTSRPGHGHAEKGDVKPQQRNMLASLRFAHADESAEGDREPKAGSGRDGGFHGSSGFRGFHSPSAILLKRLRIRYSPKKAGTVPIPSI